MTDARRRPDPDDWRRQGQERCLLGSKLIKHRYRAYRQGWDHDHCEFCWATFDDERLPDALREGWTTPDEYRWICDTCFSDFKDQFNWHIQQNSN